MSHPQTKDACARKDWLLLQQIFGFAYVQQLRAQATDAEVLAFLASQ